ncbi:MAG TPA: type II toxin-antitoxin system VapB family antitoxin [Polyangiaceae bacterium]|jgi:antitoxin VapB|nr:type II toxin-antitoxin system VapB family antitoxin [Polyangiaceae bacterium]
MTSRAKLFHNGGSQAVRLPKEYRFPESDNEVVVRREGRRVILEPIDEWPADFVSCLGAWTGTIPRPKQRDLRTVRDSFES